MYHETETYLLSAKFGNTLDLKTKAVLDETLVTNTTFILNIIGQELQE